MASNNQGNNPTSSNTPKEPTIKIVNRNGYTYPYPDDAKQIVTPYAFIRFCNERLTIRESLESLLPFFDRGIVCYHDPLPGIDEDGSVEIAREFCERNPGFRLVKYPFHVIYQNSKIYNDYLETGKIERAWLLDTYYNYALEELKALAQENGDYETAFVFKADMDHIHSQKGLESIFAYITQNPQFQNFLSYQYCVCRNPENHNKVHFCEVVNTLDTYFCKLTNMVKYAFVLVRGDHWPPKDQRSIFTPFSGIDYAGFERLVYAVDTKHCTTKFFMNSVHFNHEKHRVNNQLNEKDLELLFSKGCPLEKIDLRQMCRTYPNMLVDSTFYTEVKVLEMMKKFDYEAIEEGIKAGKHYGRQYFDEQEFLTNPKYLPMTFVKEYNRITNMINNKEIQISEQERIDRIRFENIINKILKNEYLGEIFYRKNFES